MKRIIIELTKEEWIEVIKLVEQKSNPEFDVKNWNKYNEIKTKMLFQFGMQNG